jgi:ribose 5-phosphate isomerase A
MQQDRQQDAWKQLVGETAAKLIEDGMVIGLGTGSTTAHLVYALARRLNEGLNIKGAVPTSHATEQLAASLHIPLTSLDAHPELDLALDGADEIDPHLNLIKGGGGALLREKIVASCSRRFVVMADVTKLVPYLNHTAPLPIETVPFAATPVRRQLEALGAAVQVRRVGHEVYTTDNGNMILDCFFPHGIGSPQELEDRLHRIVGVVDTGLFFNIVEQAFIAGPDGIRLLP